MSKLYIAYGSNLNKDQMKLRCPNAEPLDELILKGWKLVFKGVADIIRDEKSEVPIGIYKITKQCERALDRYEGYPILYQKKMINVNIQGNNRSALVYLMDKKFGLGPPCEQYYDVIEQGYTDWAFNKLYLINAAKHSNIEQSGTSHHPRKWSQNKLQILDLNRLSQRGK